MSTTGLREISAAGGANLALQQSAHRWWMEAAERDGINLQGFDVNAPLESRLAWARQLGLLIGLILSRFSHKLQHSTEAQVQECLTFAARHGMYVPPEFLCVDEATTGRKQRRDGLDRAKALMQTGEVGVFLVFKLSRLFRVAYKGFQFVHEHVVDQGMRGISVTQGIDTDQRQTWKALMFMHGIMDDMLLDTIADHCRAGLAALFREGFIIGAIPVGYQKVEVEGGLPTKLGRPRMRPAVDDDVAERIRRHWKLHLEGLPLRKGWQKWVREGGPCDSRAVSGRMSYAAYRRMLSNPRLTGLWAFGKTRTVWSNSRDASRKVLQPETEVIVMRFKELRIISDADFRAMQALLAKLVKGPRGPREGRTPHIWDLVTEVFHCSHCRVRFYQTGARGRGMQCKEAEFCPQKSAVRRETAVKAVCHCLSELLISDSDLIRAVKSATESPEVSDSGEREERIRSASNAVVRLRRRCEDLAEMAGHGDEKQRARMMANYRTASAELSAAQAKLDELNSSAIAVKSLPSEDEIRQALARLGELLDNAALGRLGEDVVHLAAHVFKLLVGGKIDVEVTRRANRKQTIVRGSFVPVWHAALSVVSEREIVPNETHACESVQVWLREPPRMDRLAPVVQDLVDNKGLSLPEARQYLMAQGEPELTVGFSAQCYARYYESIGQKPPKRPYNNGRPRKTRKGKFKP